jgi:hypothetical protein
MKNQEFWERFEKTGNILDYLNYTACTSEECSKYKSPEKEEGGYSGDRFNYGGDGIVSHANW